MMNDGLDLTCRKLLGDVLRVVVLVKKYLMRSMPYQMVRVRHLGLSNDGCLNGCAKQGDAQLPMHYGLVR